MTATAPVSISTDVLQRAERNARTLGLSVSEYLSRLVLNDPHPARKKLEVFPVEHGWGPVPKAVNERWDQEIAQAEADFKQGKQKGYQTAAELVRSLDA